MHQQKNTFRIPKLAPVTSTKSKNTFVYCSADGLKIDESYFRHCRGSFWSVQLTSRRETDSSAHLDKRSKQHHRGKRALEIWYRGQRGLLFLHETQIRASHDQWAAGIVCTAPKASCCFRKRQDHALVYCLAKLIRRSKGGENRSDVHHRANRD